MRRSAGRGSRPFERSGQALVEFALVLVFLLVLFAAVVDMGLIMWKSNQLTAAVRDAAIFANTKLNLQTSNDWMANSGDYAPRITNYVQGLCSHFTTTEHPVSVTCTPIASGDDPYVVSGSEQPGALRITVRHTHEFLTPISWDADGELELERSLTIRFIFNQPSE